MWFFLSLSDQQAGQLGSGLELGSWFLASPSMPEHAFALAKIDDKLKPAMDNVLGRTLLSLSAACNFRLGLLGE